MDCNLKAYLERTVTINKKRIGCAIDKLQDIFFLEERTDTSKTRIIGVTYREIRRSLTWKMMNKVCLAIVCGRRLTKCIFGAGLSDEDISIRSPKRQKASQ